MTADNGMSVSYVYNDQRLRTQRTSVSSDGKTTTVTNFYYDGSRLIGQTSGADTFWFYYDANGGLIGFELNGTQYYYVHDQLGNITGVLDANGAVVTRYTYSAFGIPYATVDGSGGDISANSSAVGFKESVQVQGLLFRHEHRAVLSAEPLQQRLHGQVYKCELYRRYTGLGQQRKHDRLLC